MSKGKKPTDPRVRFWRFVRKTKDCWEWTGACRRGYGRLCVGSRTNKSIRTVAAHRFSFEMHNGPIPPEMHVCHKCDNQRCVRPDHLFLGTAKDNQADAAAKGRKAAGDRNGSRAKPEARPRGEKHALARLAEADVRFVRASNEPGADLARRFGVSKELIYAIRKRRLWRHIT